MFIFVGLKKAFHLLKFTGLPKLIAASVCFVLRYYCTGKGSKKKPQKRSEQAKMSPTHISTEPLAARNVTSSQSEMTELVLPNDANTLGNLLGGRLMHFIDLTGAIAAFRHSRTYVVTASMDHIDFIQPVHVGDLIILKASVNRSFNTSMEVGVKVWVENIQNSAYLHVASAYLVFVAVDKEGRRIQVPPLQPETTDEKRRYEDAMRRRVHRDTEAKRRKELAKVALQVTPHV